jgi:hypothetical protein
MRVHGGSAATAHPEVILFGALGQLVADVNVAPTTEGMPGAALIQQMLNWLAQLALWGSLGSVLAGAAIYGLAQHSGNYAGGYRGKQLAFAGVIGACLAGLAPTIINMLFRAASA